MPREFQPVYIIVGDDRLGYDKLMEEKALERLRKRLSEFGDIELNSSVFNAESLDEIDDFITACETLPFASDYRLIILNNSDKAKKNLVDGIIRYLKNPSESTVLVIISEKSSKISKLIEAASEISKKSIIKAAKKRGKDTPAFVSDLAASHNVNMNIKTASALIAVVGNDPVALDTEIKKLATLVNADGRRTITNEDIERVVTRNVFSKPWQLADAFAARNLEDALVVLSEFDKDAVFAIMAVCVSRIRELLAAKALQNRSVEYESLSSIFGGQEWKYKNHRRWAENYTRDELVTSLNNLKNVEISIKSGKNGEAELEAWLISTIKTKS